MLGGGGGIKLISKPNIEQKCYNMEIYSKKKYKL